MKTGHVEVELGVLSFNDSLKESPEKLLIGAQRCGKTLSGVWCLASKREVYFLNLEAGKVLIVGVMAPGAEPGSRRLESRLQSLVVQSSFRRHHYVPHCS
jgi:hypothetical protein